MIHKNTVPRPIPEPAKTETLTFRLRPESIRQLKILSARYGGVGRAIQVAAEILHERGLKGCKQIKAALARKAERDDEPQELFSFPAVPRTKGLLAWLSLVRFDETRNLTIRACIQLLDDRAWEDEILPEIPADEVYDADKAYDRP